MNKWTQITLLSFFILGCSAADNHPLQTEQKRNIQACPQTVCGPFEYNVPDELNYLSSNLKNVWNLAVLAKAKDLGLNLNHYTISSVNKNKMPAFFIQDLSLLTASARRIHDQTFLIAPAITEAAPLFDWILKQLQHQNNLENQQKAFSQPAVRSGNAFDIANHVGWLALPFCIFKLDQVQNPKPNQNFCYSGVKNFSAKSGARVEGFASSGSAWIECYNVRNSLELTVLFDGVMQAQKKPYTSCFKESNL